MERESFENPDIGKIMNEHYVNIKVDREERPDVDRVYMTFVQVCQLNPFASTSTLAFLYTLHNLDGCLGKLQVTFKYTYKYGELNFVAL